MNLTLAEAFEALKASSAVLVDNGQLVVPDLDELTGQDNNTFLTLRWVDDDGFEFDVYFSEGRNRVVYVEDTTMKLEDDEGERATLTLLAPCPVVSLLRTGR